MLAQLRPGANLAAATRPNHMLWMISRQQWNAMLDRPSAQWALFVVGIIMIIISPVAGLLPGPGGVIVFGFGLGLVLKTSQWAKRRYVHFKRWQPKAGRWADWGLMRRSARRRERLRKEREQREMAARAD